MKKLTLLSAILVCFVLLATGQTDNPIQTGNSSRNSIPEQVKARKSFKRVEWFNTQRAWPYDTIPVIQYSHEMSREIKNAKSNASIEKELTWTSLGPRGINFDPQEWGIVGGRTKSIAVHPNDPLTLYIGTAHGGIWKTTDGGENWQDIGYGLESLAFGAIAIDPNNPETIYAGSGEVCFFLGYIGFDGKGIFKSTDGGNSWTQITNGIGTVTSFGDLAVSPFYPNLVIGALASGNYYSGNLPNEGIWKSADAGETWVRTLDVQDAYDIAFHPTEANKVYAAVGGGNSASGFYTSTDQGETWTQSNTGLPATNSMHRLQIDVSQTNPDILYAVIFNANNMSTSAYKSVNGGQSWTQISSGTYLGGNYGDGWGDQGFYDLCIAIDPENPNLVYIGNIELHRTVNGSTFAPVRPYGSFAWGSICHVDYHKLVFAPSNPNYFYIACDGGIYKSTDKGYSATSQNEGLSTLQFYRVASHPSDPQIVIGGMQDNSTAMTTDGGQTWDAVTGGDGMECLFNPGNPDTIYTSAQNGYFFRSVNGGTTFNYLVNINGSWITPLIMHPTNHKILYSANKSILKSTNGTNFQVIASNVAPEFIVALALSPVEPNNMIFASGGTQSPVPGDQIVVKVSTNGGLGWFNVTDNIPGEPRWINRVVCDPVDDSTMYILRTGFSAGNKVWKTTDLGETWTNLSGDLPDLPCSDLFIDPENTQHLYLANDIGVYHSGNGGISWEYASEGVPYVPAIDFDYVKIGTDRYLRVGTHGRSIYQTLLPNYCLPEGITFTTQAQIDNFQTNYPGCTEIEGDVTINGDDISNLNGLSVLTSIGGSLTIADNATLSSLTGLENITSIAGYLSIGSNAALTNLTGLEGLTSIGEFLSIQSNVALTSLSGLDNVTSIGGTLNILENDALTSLTGLEGLTSIGGALNHSSISGNDALTSLTGLDNLTSIGSMILHIEYNAALTSLTGLGNLTTIGGELMIFNNDALINLTGLENVTYIGGGLQIESNDALTSLTEFENLTSLGGFGLGIQDNDALANLTGLEILTSLEGLYIMNNNALTSLTGLENVISIESSLNIWDNDALTSLAGLDNVTSVGYDLWIYDNAVLTSLTGLEGLISIGGELSIGRSSMQGDIFGNPTLTSLTGLSNLTSIGGSLSIIGNASLTNLTGLEGLTSIGGDFIVLQNNVLTSLTGIDNIAAGSINDLHIIVNESLSTCDVQSICDYLASPNGYVNINNNATGCNSPEEVEEHCLTQVDELKTENGLTIIPNPSNDKITISFPAIKGNTLLSIFTVSGEKLLEMQLTDNETQIDIGTLPRGVYFVRVQDEKMIEVTKLVKQ